jgi:ketosteroid isomerase-like protein
MKQSLVITVLLITATPFVFGQTKSRKGNTSSRTEQELLKRNKEYDEALVREDASALERIFADEFIYMSTTGDLINKAQQLEAIKSGDLKVEYGKSDEVRVRVYGNTAVMTGRFIAKGEYKGKVFESPERYTAVWVKRRGRWQLVAEQGTRVVQQ